MTPGISERNRKCIPNKLTFSAMQNNTEPDAPEHWEVLLNTCPNHKKSVVKLSEREFPDGCDEFFDMLPPDGEIVAIDVNYRNGSNSAVKVYSNNNYAYFQPIYLFDLLRSGFFPTGVRSEKSVLFFQHRKGEAWLMGLQKETTEAEDKTNIPMPMMVGAIRVPMPPPTAPRTTTHSNNNGIHPGYL